MPRYWRSWCRCPASNHEEGKVPNPVHNEGFIGSSAVFEILVPEANQEVGAQSDAFPSEEQHYKVIAQHQVQHHKDEQVQIGEKAPKTVITMHIAYGVEVDKTTNTRNNEGHEQRQLIDAVSKVNGQVSSLHP
jgi:hypothetical protein